MGNRGCPCCWVGWDVHEGADSVHNSCSLRWVDFVQNTRVLWARPLLCSSVACAHTRPSHCWSNDLLMTRVCLPACALADGVTQAQLDGSISVVFRGTAATSEVSDTLGHMNSYTGAIHRGCILSTLSHSYLSTETTACQHLSSRAISANMCFLRVCKPTRSC
jgi:hypothetical protein